MKCGKRRRQRNDIIIMPQPLERIVKKKRMKKRRRDFKVKCQKKMIAQRVEWSSSFQQRHVHWTRNTRGASHPSSSSFISSFLFTLRFLVSKRSTISRDGKTEPRGPSTIAFSIFFLFSSFEALVGPWRDGQPDGILRGFRTKEMKREDSRIERKREWLGLSFLRLSLPLGNRGVQEKVVPRKRRRFDPSPISHSFFFIFFSFPSFFRLFWSKIAECKKKEERTTTCPLVPSHQYTHTSPLRIRWRRRAEGGRGGSLCKGSITWY